MEDKTIVTDAEGNEYLANVDALEETGGFISDVENAHSAFGKVADHRSSPCAFDLAVYLHEIDDTMHVISADGSSNFESVCDAHGYDVEILYIESLADLYDAPFAAYMSLEQQ